MAKTSRADSIFHIPTIRRRQAGEEGTALSLPGAWDLLDRLRLDPRAMQELRRLVAAEDAGLPAFRLSDQDVLDHVARALAEGRLTAAPRGAEAWGATGSGGADVARSEDQDGFLDQILDPIMDMVTAGSTPKLDTYGLIPIKDATDAQRKMIRKAHQGAEKMIARALGRLKKAKKKPDHLVNEVFGIGGTSAEDQQKLDRIVSRFEKMQASLARASYDVDVEPYSSGKANRAGWVSIVPGVGGDGDVHICVPWYEKLSMTQQEGVIVHEIAHNAFGAADTAYEHQEDKWNAMSQEEQMNNADSYRVFATDA